MVLMIAATMYFFQLGRAGFDDAEAYSAYIASRPTLRAVFTASLNLDPGKGGGLYALALHWYCGLFGTGEVALRAFSAAFALASVMLVYALAGELFGAETALVAAALWAFNPMASIVARWALTRGATAEREKTCCASAIKTHILIWKASVRMLSSNSSGTAPPPCSAA